MYAKQHGIILVVCLIFLFIFTLLALAAFSDSQLQLRMNNNLAERLQQREAAEAGLLAGEKVLLAAKNSSCIINAVKQPWLADHPCTLIYNAQSVDYIVEPLLVNACFELDSDQEMQPLLKETNIYRITAWINHPDYYPIILQTTYAKTSDKTCLGPVSSIQNGRLSWREIYSY